MLKKVAWNRQLVLALWLVTVYLMVLYAAMRVGTRFVAAPFPGQ